MTRTIALISSVVVRFKPFSYHAEDPLDLKLNVRPPEAPFTTPRSPFNILRHHPLADKHGELRMIFSHETGVFHCWSVCVRFLDHLLTYHSR